MNSIVQRRLPHLGGDWFASECPADLERNGWPVWIGMGGRFASEYAAKGLSGAAAFVALVLLLPAPIAVLNSFLKKRRRNSRD